MKLKAISIIVAIGLALCLLGIAELLYLSHRIRTHKCTPCPEIPTNTTDMEVLELDVTELIIIQRSNDKIILTKATK